MPPVEMPPVEMPPDEVPPVEMPPVEMLPDEVPPERAVLAANLETAINGIWDARPHVGDRIAVVVRLDRP